MLQNVPFGGPAFRLRGRPWGSNQVSSSLGAGLAQKEAAVEDLSDLQGGETLGAACCEFHSRPFLIRCGLSLRQGSVSPPCIKRKSLTAA